MPFSWRDDSAISKYSSGSRFSGSGSSGFEFFCSPFMFTWLFDAFNSGWRVVCWQLSSPLRQSFICAWISSFVSLFNISTNCLKDAAQSPVISGYLRIFIFWGFLFKDVYQSGLNLAILVVGLVWIVKEFPLFCLRCHCLGLQRRSWISACRPWFHLRRIWTRYRWTKL